MARLAFLFSRRPAPRADAVFVSSFSSVFLPPMSASAFPVISVSPAAPRFSALGTRAHPPTIARLMDMALENPAVLSLAAGFTDNRTQPVAAVRAVVEELVGSAGEPEYLQYGSNAGRPGLRRLLAARLATWDKNLTPAQVVPQTFITNGSQQALYLAMQVLCEPGDIVLVDRPSYFVYLEMLAGLGVKAVSIPVDAAGEIDGAALEGVLSGLVATGRREKVKAVYFVSYFSNPSGRSLSAEEKRTLATMLSAQGFVVPIVEDAAYRELHYTTPETAPSVLGDAVWEAFPRLYLSTLTKPFASGLKVGFGVCSDATWLAKMLHVKGHQDFGSANFNQAIMERVLAAGGLDEQLGRIRPAYERKMHALHDGLRAAGLAELGWRWAQPLGGLYLWLEAPAHIDTGMAGAFCHDCVTAGVLYVPGDLCFGDAPTSHHVRLSFGVLPEPELAEAARRFAAVARQHAAA